MKDLEKSVDKRIMAIVANFVNKDFKFQTKEIQEVCWYTVSKQLERYKEMDFKNLDSYLDREKYWNDRIFKIPVLEKPCCLRSGF